MCVGARGNVHVPYMTISGKAKGGGVDYLDSFGDLEFKNDETFKYIRYNITSCSHSLKSLGFSLCRHQLCVKLCPNLNKFKP